MARNHSSRVRDKILAYAEAPESQANNVARLQGAGGLLRLRVGDWRVIMRVDDRIEILRVGSRGRAYRGDS